MHHDVTPYWMSLNISVSLKENNKKTMDINCLEHDTTLLIYFDRQRLTTLKSNNPLWALDERR